MKKIMHVKKAKNYTIKLQTLARDLRRIVQKEPTLKKETDRLKGRLIEQSYIPTKSWAEWLRLHEAIGDVTVEKYHGTYKITQYIDGHYETHYWDPESDQWT